MNVNDMRSALAGFRIAVDRRAAELKDPQVALEELILLYQRFSESERTLANEVIAEWLDSNDEGLRFDALALINHFAIDDAFESLERLAERLRAMKTPGAPYELDKVVRLLARFHDDKSVVPGA